MATTLSDQMEFLFDALTHQDLDSLQTFIVEHLPGLLWSGSVCSLFLYDNARDQFVLRATSNDSLRDKVNAEGYFRGEGLTGWVGKYGVPLFLQDARDINALARYGDPSIGIPVPVWSGKVLEGPQIACMAVPIQSEKAIPPLGVIRLAPRDEATSIPDENREELFERIGRLVSLAVHYAQRDEFFASTMESAHTGYFDAVLRSFLEFVSISFRSFSSHIRLIDRSRNVWYTLAVSQSPYSSVIVSRPESGYGRLISQILTGKSTHFHNDRVQYDSVFAEVLNKARRDEPDYARYLEQIGATLIVPLRETDNPDSIIGMLNLHRFAGDSFDEKLEIPQLISIGYFLERFVRALKESDRRRGEMVVTKHLEQGNWHEDKLFDIILRGSLAETDGDLALLRLVDGVTGKLKLIESRRRDGCIVSGTIPQYRALGEVGSGIAARTKEPYLVSNTRGDSIYSNERAEAMAAGDTSRVDFLDWIGSIIATPMLASGSVFGSLVVLSSQPGKFGPRDLHRFQGVTKEAAYRLHFSQIKNQFLTRASHELSKPLTPIKMFADMLNREEYGSLNETQREFAWNIFINAQQLERLTKHLVDLDKILTGRLELERSLVDVVFELTNSVERARTVAETKRISIRLESPASVKGAADKMKLSCVMDNLLDNSVKFTPGGGEIDVRLSLLQDVPVNRYTHELRGQTPWLVVTVSDTGDGLNACDLESIFSLFEQVPSPSSKPQQGAGIGLSLSRSFVELHGGAIWAESDGVGTGCKFTFVLPLPASL